VGKAMGETVTTTANTTKANDSTSYGVTYAAGAFYAGVTGETVTGATAAASKIKHSTTAITYDLGMVKVGYALGKTTEGTDYDKANAFSITVPVGALTLAYSSGDGKSKSGTTAEAKTKISQMGAMYSLSKRTTAYFQTGKVTAATITSTNITAIGVKHTF
jgi:predicted porin